MAENLQDALTYFKALAEQTRLRLLKVLMRHELNVNELVAIMAMGQSRISHHLKVLTESGLLSWRREGSKVYYSACTQGPGAEVIERVGPLLADDEVSDQDLARARDTIEQRAEATRRFFNAIAANWDQLRRDVLGDLDLAGAVTGQMAGHRVAVDLGCGTGGMLPALLERAERVIGVDSSPKMLQQARRRFANDGRRVSLRIGELEHLPLRDGEADFAVASLALHHLSRPQDGLVEAHRVLQDGGRLVVVEFDRHHNEQMRTRYGDHWLGFSLKRLAGWLERSGFSLAQTRRLPVNQGLAVHILTANKNQQ